jgi:hypothetical protein
MAYLMDTPATQPVRFLTVEATGQRALIDPVLESYPAFLIGGDARSHLQLTDPQVAPAHAVITSRDDGLALAPRYPALPVLVNNRRIRGRVILQPEDTVQIGAMTLKVGQQAMSLPSGSLPQVRSAPVARSIQSTRLPVISSPKLALAAPTSSGITSGEIYFPTQKTATGSSLSGAFLGALTVLGIVIALGFVILQNTPGLLTPVIAGAATNPFAFRDGNITVLMFDADW